MGTVNAATTLLPLVGFSKIGGGIIVLNPNHVTHIEPRGHAHTFIQLVTGDSFIVDGTLLTTRQALQGTPWYAVKKLAEFITELEDHLDDRADADIDTCNPEMRLLSQLTSVKSLLKEHGFIA
jgi:hypothetical protein